jgi:LacI family transcriptional regulator
MAKRNDEKKSGARKENAGKPGRMPNIYDVAKEANVSVYTVSAVMNNASQVSATLQKRVLAAIRKLNYRPNLLARSLARRQSHTIGIIVTDIANPFFPLLVRGAEDVLQKAGYSTLLCNSDDHADKEAHYLEFLLSKRVDGILLVKTPGKLSVALRQMLEDVKVPVGLIMRACNEVAADLVMTDDRLGAFEAVSHLARVGHRRIGFVGGPSTVSNAKSRRQGYLEALKENSLEDSPDLTYEGDYRFESGYRAGLTLLPRRPDAVFVANYLMMVGFMKAADEMGVRCPRDFGMVSFDDYPWLGSFHPRMTTVELPKYELGEQSAGLLLERIAGKRTKLVNVKLLPQLRVRESCGFNSRTQGAAASSKH